MPSVPSLHDSPKATSFGQALPISGSKEKAGRARVAPKCGQCLPSCRDYRLFPASQTLLCCLSCPEYPSPLAFAPQHAATPGLLGKPVQNLEGPCAGGSGSPSSGPVRTYWGPVSGRGG
ncbi:hypothetical protein E2I00_015824 [Balaenoptera physalus]|uniref:Uncharacterized protein n=1 Tax=Balaenoptera physalus TaxID=9770 RepID=A0A643CGZ1_BALPH|nr:hypothetical protein E2I00_015824 [Balaenoptera physalus]